MMLTTPAIASDPPKCGLTTLENFNPLNICRTGGRRNEGALPTEGRVVDSHTIYQDMRVPAERRPAGADMKTAEHAVRPVLVDGNAGRNRPRRR